MGLPGHHPREAWHRVDEGYGYEEERHAPPAWDSDYLAAARRTVLDFRGGGSPSVRLYDDVDDAACDAGHYQPGVFGFGTAFVSARPAPAPPPPPPPAPEEPEDERVRRLRPAPQLYEERYEPVPRMSPRRSDSKRGRRGGGGASTAPRSRRTHRRPFVVRAKDGEKSCGHCDARFRWGEPLPVRACDSAKNLHCACVSAGMASGGY